MRVAVWLFRQISRSIAWPNHFQLSLPATSREPRVNNWTCPTCLRFLPTTIDLTLPREHSLLPDGSWIDRSTAGSPLIHEGLAYTVDIYGWLYVSDLETKATVYYQDLELDGLMHYNAVPVAASPTLIGDKILVLDNQGTTVVLAPGREFKVLGRNRIETRLERVWPIPAQETLAYAPPIADANCLYLRGERYLYCIGEK